MKPSRTIAEKIISSILFIVGLLLTCQAIFVIYQYHFTDMLRFESYMIYMTTLVSNLINGIILVISSSLFFINKQKGASFYIFSAIMFMLYAINLNVLDIVVYSIDILFVLVSIIVFFLGLFLYLYFKNKRSSENLNLKQEKIFIILGIAINLLIDLVFYNWYPCAIMNL